MSAKMAKQDLNGMLETIAKNFLGIGTLKPRNSDSLDFHEVSVWCLKAALEEAYKAGRCHPNMKQLKERILETQAAGAWQSRAPEEQILFSMVLTDATNLLDILVIQEQFYWHVPNWSLLLKKYDVHEIMVDLNETNGAKMLEAFQNEGWKESRRATIKMDCNHTINGVVLSVH